MARLQVFTKALITCDCSSLLKQPQDSRTNGVGRFEPCERCLKKAYDRGYRAGIDSVTYVGKVSDVL